LFNSSFNAGCGLGVPICGTDDITITIDRFTQALGAIEGLTRQA
jgi:hypothetical protein